jgi:hypothetical protein
VSPDASFEAEDVALFFAIDFRHLSAPAAVVSPRCSRLVVSTSRLAAPERAEHAGLTPTSQST